MDSDSGCSDQLARQEHKRVLDELTDDSEEEEEVPQQVKRAKKASGFRYSKVEAALTFAQPQRFAHSTVTVHKVLAAIQRKCKKVSQYLVVQERHKDGEAHFHAWLHAGKGQQFDFRSPTFEMEDSLSNISLPARFEDMTQHSGSHGWIKYMLKDYQHEVWLENPAAYATNIVCSEPDPWNIGMEERPELLDHLAKSKTYGDAIRKAQGLLKLTDKQLIRSASGLKALHEAVRPVDEEVKYVPSNSNVPSDFAWPPQGVDFIRKVQQWEDRTLSLFRDKKRFKILLVVGPTLIGKTEAVKWALGVNNAYCNNDYHFAIWNNAPPEAYIILDDIDIGKVGGPDKPPMKAWTQPSPWMASMKYQNARLYQPHPVVIIANELPGWMQEAYWAQNVEFIDLSRQFTPLYLAAGSAELAQWQRENRVPDTDALLSGGRGVASARPYNPGHILVHSTQDSPPRPHPDPASTWWSGPWPRAERQAVPETP